MSHHKPTTSLLRHNSTNTDVSFISHDYSVAATISHLCCHSSMAIVKVSPARMLDSDETTLAATSSAGIQMRTGSRLALLGTGA